MNLLPGICTQCGSNLEVDPSKESAICPFCGTPFITEKVINNYTYNTTNTTNIEHLHADVVKVSDERGIDAQIRSAETFVKLGQVGDASKIYTKLTEECPYDHRAWWGLLLIKTDNFNQPLYDNRDIGRLDYLFNSAITVANEQEKKKMEEQYIPFIKDVKERYEVQKSEYQAQMNAIYKKGEIELKKYEEELQRLTERKDKICADNQNKVTEIPSKFKWIAGISILVLSLIFGSIISGIIILLIGYIVLKILSSKNEKAKADINRQEYEIAREIDLLNGTMEAITYDIRKEADPLMLQYTLFTSEFDPKTMKL